MHAARAILAAAALLGLAACPSAPPALLVVNDSPSSVEGVFLDPADGGTPDTWFHPPNLLSEPIGPFETRRIPITEPGVYRLAVIEYMSSEPYPVETYYQEIFDDNWHIFWQWGTGEQGRPAVRVDLDNRVVLRLWTDGDSLFGCDLYYD
jgi:hypothetical protein